MTQFWEWYLFTIVYGLTVYLRGLYDGKRQIRKHHSDKTNRD